MIYNHPRFLVLLWETLCSWSLFQMHEESKKRSWTQDFCYILFLGCQEKSNIFWYLSAKNYLRLQVSLQSEEDSEHYTLRSLEVVYTFFCHVLLFSNVILDVFWFSNVILHVFKFSNVLFCLQCNFKIKFSLNWLQL